jgi:mono/diheme cytochrome c family protein
MKRTIQLLVFGCFVVSFAMAAGSAADGKAIFTKSCQGCHGPTGQGNPTMAKMLKAEMKPLGGPEVQGKSDDDLKKVITQGSGKMKPVPSVAGKQADDVVAYVRTLKQ